MNPIELQRILSPLVGEGVASSIAIIAARHKSGCSFMVTVPSDILVMLAEKLAEKSVP